MAVGGVGSIVVVICGASCICWYWCLKRGRVMAAAFVEISM